MVLPNYKDSSIVNLMSSIGSVYSHKSIYEELKILKSNELKKYKNIVLVVVDGLGYEFIQKYGKGSFLYNNIRDKITSVFPSATSCAMTAFSTGDSTQQHALVGWYTYFKEIAMLSIPLPYVTMQSWISLSESGVDIDKIMNFSSFNSKIKNVEKITITRDDLADSDFTNKTLLPSKIISYKSLNGFFKEIQSNISIGKKKKYVLAYWPKLDVLEHEFGPDSKEVKEHFFQLDKKFESLFKKLNDDTLVIVTADHGLIGSPKNRRVDLNKHSKLKECLSMPLSGDGRVKYCYVKLSKKDEFENYILKNLDHVCEMHKSEDLIKKNYFGLGKENSKLRDRVGDYTLIMKDNYLFNGSLLDKKTHFEVGNHGGTSEEEMFVPLILLKKK
ncbi:MAG: alkaline phosphatase family protein [Nanoarchaeota archaeon]|nr:alkaline phosphatase family protein [Nanoarchaeota archaeon]